MLRKTFFNKLNYSNSISGIHSIAQSVAVTLIVQKIDSTSVNRISTTQLEQSIYPKLADLHDFMHHGRQASMCMCLKHAALLATVIHLVLRFTAGTRIRFSVFGDWNIFFGCSLFFCISSLICSREISFFIADLRALIASSLTVLRKDEYGGSICSRGYSEQILQLQ